MEQLQEYIVHLQTTEMDMEDLGPWRMIMIPDYKENQSILVPLGHHAFIDGVQFFAFCQTLDRNLNFDLLPRMKPPSFW